MIDPSHPRLSELALCPRACACRGLGHEPAEPTERMRNLFERGHMDEEWIARRYKARYAPKRVYRQVDIPWPLGVGHADLVVPSAKLITEVKSTAYLDSMYDQALRQVRLYLRFYKPGYRGAAHFLNPATMEETVVPVLLHSGHVDAIDEEVEAVRQAVAGGVLPPCRLGDSPSTCRCAFKDSAWDDYVEPEFVDSLPGHVKRRLEEAWSERELVKATEKRAEERWEQAKALALEHGLQPGLDYRIGHLHVRVTEIKGRETFSIRRARASGKWPEVAMLLRAHGFDWSLKIGEPSQRWSVKRLSSPSISTLPDGTAVAGSGETVDPSSAPESAHSVRAELLS